MLRSILCALLLAMTAPALADTTITYQGQLQKDGVPYDDDPVGMEFRLYDALTGGSQVGDTVQMTAVDVVDGLFQVELDFGAVWDGGERYLEIMVAGQTLSPRERVTPAPLAIKAIDDSDTTYSAGSGLTLSGATFTLDTAVTDARYWNMGGDSGSNPAKDFLGTTDTTPFEIHVGGERVLRLEPADVPNVVSGWAGNNIAADVIGAAISGGGCPDLGSHPCNSDNPNRIWGNFSTIGGGVRNLASGERSTIGGGRANGASGMDATVGGGHSNTAGGEASTVGGGSSNSASGEGATIGGGIFNRASALYSTVPGGYSNNAEADYSFAAGRRAHVHPGHVGAFVWADSTNADFSSTDPNQFLIRANGGVGIATNQPEQALHVNGNIEAEGWIGTSREHEFSIVLGNKPAITLIHSGNLFGPSIVAGHDVNRTENDASGAVISGGGRGSDGLISESPNIATGSFATISGGFGNTAAQEATISGGHDNLATGEEASIGGGRSNVASGITATIPGGFNNEASGSTSLAAGARAGALHHGSFVWSDLSESSRWESTNEDQFLIRAAGGVGIGTNSPRNQLDVVREKSGSSSNVNHVMTVHNTATSQGNVLALQSGADTPGAAENYITFKSGISNVGAIEGDGSGGVTLKSGSADFAEYLPKIAPGETIAPADVVGVKGGTVSLRTTGSERAMVVSTRPIVAGNDPGDETEAHERHVAVAFLGQVPVRVTGAVEAGDYLLPSGQNDGTAIAVHPDQLALDQVGQVIGQAMEGTRSDSQVEVRALVGLPQAAVLESLIERRDKRLTALRSRVERTATQMAQLQQANAELREQVAALAREQSDSRELRERIAALEDLLLSDLQTSQTATMSKSK